MTSNKKLLSLPPPGKIRHERAIAKYSNFALVQWLVHFPLVNVAIVITASLNFPRELISLCLTLKLLFQDLLLWSYLRHQTKSIVFEIDRLFLIRLKIWETVNVYNYWELTTFMSVILRLIEALFRLRKVTFRHFVFQTRPSWAF